MTELFDMKLRAQRRDRAARIGPELFLLERVFDDCLERLGLVNRHFDRALLIGCPDCAWLRRTRPLVREVQVADPGALFAAACGGVQLVEDDWAEPEAAFDLVVSIGTLDTVNDLPRALRSIRMALRPDSLFIGAMSGGDTLPQLRRAMRAADEVVGAATAHAHPRVEAASLAALLGAAGFATPVVDVDRVQVAYSSFERLVRDLRAMGSTNILTARSREILNRRARSAAIEQFNDSGGQQRTTEVFEILHFAAWTPPSRRERLTDYAALTM